MSIYHLEDTCPETEGSITLLTDEATPATKLIGETLGCMVVDSGCIHTVCGKNWLESYLESLSVRDRKSVSTENGHTLFRFGNGVAFRSLKRVTVPVYLGNLRARISTDVVDCEIPLLFSKESLKRGNGEINFVKDRITILKQSLPLGTTSTGHYFIRISRDPDGPVESVSDVLFSVNVDDLGPADMRKTALKLHKQFAHPPAHKLINLLNRANIENDELENIIRKISADCDTCLRYHRSPSKPVVAFPLASRFNETVAMDLKDIRPGFKILHMVDHATRYGQATVVSGKSAQETVRSIFDIWIRVFGCPGKILMDNGGEFDNRELIDLCDKCNVRVLTTAAESPWSNGLVEKHNDILGQMILKLTADEPMDPKLATHWAVAAKNALSTVYGFSPNILVFGMNPNLPNAMTNSIAANDPDFHSNIVRENLNALHAARKAFMHQESSEKLARALNRQTRTYGDKPFLIGDDVFYKRNQSSRWQGPAKVLGKDSNQVLIKHGSSYLRVHPCRLLHKKEASDNSEQQTDEGPNKTSKSVNGRNLPYEVQSEYSEDENTSHGNNNMTSPTTTTPEEESVASLEPNVDQQNVEDDPIVAREDDSLEPRPLLVKEKELRRLCEDNGTTVPSKNSIFKYLRRGEKEERTATCMGRAGKAKTANWHFINIHDHDSNTKCCVSVKDDMEYWKYSTERNDTLLAAREEMYMEPKLAELRKWREMKVYTEVEDNGQKRISCRWVCTERLKAGKLEAKARLCARGCEDIEDVPTDSPTCERDNVRLMLSMAASFEWTLNAIDFKSAYLQGEDLDRDIYLVPPKEAGTSKLWKLKKCVYGINDAGKKWYNELRKTLISLGTEISKLDQAVFFAKHDGILHGIILLHVDDTLWAGTESFAFNVIKPLVDKFLVSSEEQISMRYLGLSLSGKSGKCKLDLGHYVRNLEEIPLDPGRRVDETVNSKELNLLRVVSGKLNWLSAQGRPDLSFSSCQTACTIKCASVRDLKQANKIVRRAKGMEYNLTFHSLGDPSTWEIVCYSDASWGNLPDGGSQGGFLLFLTGEDGIANLITWQSHRLKRVARSTIAAETLSLVDACEASILIANQLREMLDCKDALPITLVTDNESLANAVRSTTSVEEKRLRIDISALREMLNRREISQIKWVPTEDQLADCLTKQGAKLEKLLAVLRQQMRLDITRLRFMPSRHE